jgi:hypothetical protein
MARGFNVRITLHDPDWLTAGHVVEVAREQSQWLSELEVTKFIPAAVEAAKALVAAIEHGPFFVTFQGVDSFGVDGEATVVTVSVDTAATKIPDSEPVIVIMSSEPEVEAAAETVAESEGEPSGETDGSEA